MINLRIEFQLLVIISIIYLTLALPVVHHRNDVHKQNNVISHKDHLKEQNKNLDGRIKRQLDLDLSVEHEEDAGTDITAALSANLWKSADGMSRLDGSARYNKHFDEFRGNGKGKITGSIHFIHNY